VGEYRLLEHTADMGIEALGASCEELFIQTARGLMAILCPDARTSTEAERRLRVTGLDREELLVNWLNEILYLLQGGDFFPVDFEIEEMGETLLSARVRGEAFDPERHPVEREIKAVTYHRLRVEEVDGRWRARVYVDL